ncbi:substrate-binding periplasmic protein [Pseudoduganella lurida]|nr:transporter substrate-binding domain-containing protein [Pseudoduganella lurida]
MTVRFIFAAAVLACALPSFAAPPAAAPWRIATSDLPPLSIERDPAKPGALTEIVRELAKRAGVPASVEFVPWKRALFMATQPRTAIFPLTRTPERENAFRWLAPLYREQFVFMAEAGGTNVADLAALRQRRIAILRGSAQVENLKAMGYTRLVPTASMVEGLRFVHQGMADAIYGDQAIVSHTARRLYPQGTWTASAALLSTTTWLGGSPDFGEDEAAALQAALEAMRADGSYARILRSYALPR